MAGWSVVNENTKPAAPTGWTPVPEQKIARKPGMDAQQLRAGGWTTEDLLKAGFGAAALANPEEISGGPEQPVEQMMSPASQKQATKGGIAFASTIPLAMVPGSWPLIGKVAASSVVGAATGAAQTAVDKSDTTLSDVVAGNVHPSGSDMLKNMAEQGALYGGTELGAGLLSRAFSFLRGLRGVKQAASATAAETASIPKSATPTQAGTLSEMATPPAKPAPPVPTEKPAGDIIAERLGILDKDPQSLITSSLKPGKNNFNWAADMQKAFPDLKAAEAELGQPIKTFADAKATVKTAKANLWSQFEAKLNQVKSLGPNAPSLTNIDGNKVADAMVSSIDARTAAQNPALVRRITKVANTYRHTMSVDEAEEFLESANNELNSYYAKNKVGQEVAARDPETGHVVREANELRNQLYAKLDELTGPGARELKQRYGALSNFQDVLSKRENIALQQQPVSLAEQISKARAYAKIAVGVARGDPWSVYEGVQQSTAATWLKERQTSEAMMERAFANYGRPSAAAAPKVVSPQMPRPGTLRRMVNQQQAENQ